MQAAKQVPWLVDNPSRALMTGTRCRYRPSTFEPGYCFTSTIPHGLLIAVDELAVKLDPSRSATGRMLIEEAMEGRARAEARASKQGAAA